MVNCKKCGAPLSLNDAYCPHCGTANPEAQEHLKKLQVLDAQVESAKQEVTAEVKKSKKGYGVLIILAMLLLAKTANPDLYEDVDPQQALRMLTEEAAGSAAEGVYWYAPAQERTP